MPELLRESRSWQRQLKPPTAPLEKARYCIGRIIIAASLIALFLLLLIGTVRTEIDAGYQELRINGFTPTGAPGQWQLEITNRHYSPVWLVFAQAECPMTDPFSTIRLLNLPINQSRTIYLNNPDIRTPQPQCRITHTIPVRTDNRSTEIIARGLPKQPNGDPRIINAPNRDVLTFYQKLECPKPPRIREVINIHQPTRDGISTATIYLDNHTPDRSDRECESLFTRSLPLTPADALNRPTAQSSPENRQRSRTPMPRTLSVYDLRDSELSSNSPPPAFQYWMGKYMRQEISRWNTFRFRQSPQPRLELFIDPKGRPSLTLIRNRDNTITARGPGKNITCEAPAYWLNQLKDRLAAAAIRSALEQYRKNKPREFRENLPAYLTARAVSKGKNNPLYHWANIPEHIGKQSRAWQQESRKINRIINGTFIDQQLIARQEEMLNRMLRDYPWLDRYNWINRNKRTINAMRGKSRNVLIFYCKFLNCISDEHPKRLTPEYITRRVRNYLNLDKAQWRWFYIINPHNTGQIRQHTRFLTDLNLPYINQQEAAEIFRDIYHCLDRATDPETRWNHGDPWKALIHLTRTVFEHHRKNDDRPAGERRSDILKHLSDALEWHIEHDQPWPRTCREAYQRRADRWVAELTRENENSEMLRLQQQNWQSLLDRQTIGPVTANPLTNAWELNLAGRAMKNCLASYAWQCQQGNSRIFTLTQEERPIAAMELHRQTNGWSLRQLEGSERKIPTDEQTHAARIITMQYQEAWKRNRRMQAAA